MKNNREYELLLLLDKFIRSTKNGRRVQKSGKRIAKGTIRNYQELYRLLSVFSQKNEFRLRIKPAYRLSKKELKVEQNYWKKFYKRYTDFLYDDLDYYDNFVGSQIKLLRAFFNYVNDELLISTGNFQRLFYAHNEEIPVIVLSPERLNFLIHNKEFEAKLSWRLQKVKDIFVFGCTVALRVSDLMNLKQSNLEQINGRYYLSVRSQKTKTDTRVKLPQYAVDILGKYKLKKNK